MGSHAIVRILVHLQHHSSSPRLALFSKCIFSQLGISQEDNFPLEENVECQLIDNKLILRVASQNPRLNNSASEIPSYQLKHPPFCPFFLLSEEDRTTLPLELSNRGVDVGVVVLLESIDGRLLLTRRASHMRTFPKVWVPPGGHIEDGETLQEAGLRELAEETGLVVSPLNPCMILGLWESVFPPILGMGEPKRHHIVVYLHVHLEKSSHDVQAELKLNPDEVEACAWLETKFVQAVVNNSEDLPEDSLPVTLVNREGEQWQGDISTEFLKGRINKTTTTANLDGEIKPINTTGNIGTPTTSGLNVERISTGSRYALSLWLKQFKTYTNTLPNLSASSSKKSPSSSL